MVCRSLKALTMSIIRLFAHIYIYVWLAKRLDRMGGTFLRELSISEVDFKNQIFFQLHILGKIRFKKMPLVTLSTSASIAQIKKIYLIY